MKTLVTALVMVAVAGSAFAGINTTKPMGPLDIMIYGDGTAAMINNSAAAFLFDGWTLESVAGVLPADVQGINDNAWTLGAPFATMLGLTMQTATAFQEMSTTATNYSEVTMNVGATLQAGDAINLGGGFGALNQANGTFTYVDSTLPVGSTSFEGRIIPEPTTMSLLGLGVLALVRRRR